MRKAKLTLVIFTLLGLLSLPTFAAEGNAEKPAVQPDKTTTTTIEPVKPVPGTLEKPTSIFGDVIVTVEGTIADLPKELDPAVPVSITVVNGDVKTTVVLERPDVLKFKEVVLANGAKISITGWKVTEKEKTFVKAREITLGEKKITLLNASGNKTWTDFEVSVEVVLQGTIQNVVMPTAEPAPDATAKPVENVDPTKTQGEKPVKAPQKNVSFDLVTDKETIKFADFCPFSFALKNKLALANGQKVIITAKQRAAKGALTVMKISIVCVANSELKLRDENGNPMWMQRNTTKPKTEGDKPKENPAPKEQPKKEL